MTEMSAGDISGVVTAGATIAGLLGGAISFVWVRFEITHRTVKKELQKCNEREARGRERRGVLTTVIELLWQEVQRLAPDAHILLRAKKLLDDIRMEDHKTDERDLEL